MIAANGAASWMDFLTSSRSSPGTCRVRPIIRSARAFSHPRLRPLPRSLCRGAWPRTTTFGRFVVRFGLALELYRWHPTIPKALVLASGYAGWAGPLPSEVAEQRKQRMLNLIESPPQVAAQEFLTTLLTDAASPELVDEVRSILSDFHPAGQRALLRGWVCRT